MSILPPGATTKLKLPKQPDRYPNMDFEPVDYAEFPKAVYVESPHLSGSSKVEGLDHLEHKMPRIVNSPEEEADLRRQDDDWKAQESERKAKEEEKANQKPGKG